MGYLHHTPFSQDPGIIAEVEERLQESEAVGDDEETVVSGQLHTGAHSSYDNMHKPAQALKPDKPSMQSDVDGRSHPWLRHCWLSIAVGRRKLIFFRAVTPATSAVLQSVTTQPKVYEQHKFDVMSLKEDIKFGGGGGGGGKSWSWI